jgi:hypothetical protein
MGDARTSSALRRPPPVLLSAVTRVGVSLTRMDLVPGYSNHVDAGHGTTASYRRGCLCDDCRAANAADHRERIARFAAEGGRGEHGTVYRYKTGCRCEDCRAANTEHHRQLMARYRATGGRGEHGTPYRYATGCRCVACTAANAGRLPSQPERHEAGLLHTAVPMPQPSITSTSSA